MWCDIGSLVFESVLYIDISLLFSLEVLGAGTPQRVFYYCGEDMISINEPKCGLVVVRAFFNTVFNFGAFGV